MGRAPTPEEKAVIQGWLPGLAPRGNWRVTGEVWESKLGQERTSPRVLHRLEELEDGNYGRLAKLYRRASARELQRLRVTPITPVADGKDPCAGRL